MRRYSVLNILNNLALLLWAQGDLAGARALLERALAIMEKVLDPEHPSTATCLNNLALLLWAQGDLAGARPLFERALAIAEKVLGLEHPSTATIREYLARFGRHSRRQAALLGGDLIKVAFETPGRLLDLCSALEAQIEYLDEPALAAIDASTSQSQ